MPTNKERQLADEAIEIGDRAAALARSLLDMKPERPSFDLSQTDLKLLLKLCRQEESVLLEMRGSIRASSLNAQLNHVRNLMSYKLPRLIKGCAIEPGEYNAKVVSVKPSTGGKVSMKVRVTEKAENKKQAAPYVFTFNPRKKTPEGEYVIRCYKNGVRHAKGDYFTPDLDDATATYTELVKKTY